MFLIGILTDNLEYFFYNFSIFHKLYIFNNFLKYENYKLVFKQDLFYTGFMILVGNCYLHPHIKSANQYTVSGEVLVWVSVLTITGIIWYLNQ
jgi:hypothetical protein